MFAAIAKQLDELFELEEDTFCEVVALLYNLPIWKLCGFYCYTWTYIKQREKGRDYRICLKWVTFPYMLRYRMFVTRMKRLFW